MKFSQEITPFTSYELTDQELLAGQIFSNEQLAVLQNEIAILATKKVELVVDPRYPAEAAEIDGQISILRFLIERSGKLAFSTLEPEVPISFTDEEDNEGFPSNAMDL